MIPRHDPTRVPHFTVWRVRWCYESSDVDIEVLEEDDSWRRRSPRRAQKQAS